MPFDQLRSLVVSLIEPEPEPGDDPASEFDSRGTTYRGPRTSTLDQLIAFLRKQ